MHVLLSNHRERILQNSSRRNEQTCFSAQRSTAVQNQSLYSLSFVLFGLLLLSLCQRQQSLDNSCIKIFKNLLLLLLIIVVINQEQIDPKVKVPSPVDLWSSLFRERLLLMKGAAVKDEVLRDEKLRLPLRRIADLDRRDAGLVP